MAEMKLEVPQDLVMSIVRAEVVKALGKSEELIGAVVTAAMAQKKDSYSRQTIFEEQVSEMIRKVATDCFQEWLSENREKIRGQFTAALTASKGKAIKDMIDKLFDAQHRIFVKGIDIDLRER